MPTDTQLSVKVNEIFESIQDESSYAGLPCFFIRLSGCNLRCSYCDTRYAYNEGRNIDFAAIIKKINASDTPIVELTGGEPLIQKNSFALINEIIRNFSETGTKRKLLIETSGSASIKSVNKKAIIIMDVKTPSSGMSEMMDFDNISYLKKNDEVKFVIGSRKDYIYSKKIIELYALDKKCGILFSAVYGKIKPEAIVGWMLKDNIKARFQLQMHKYIWPPDARGV